MEKKCLECGGSLAGRGRAAKFCSDDCIKAHRAKMDRAKTEAAWKTRPCKRCGHPFRAHPNQVYCGVACVTAGSREKRNARYRELTQKGSRFCVGCGAQFPPETNRGRQYCSAACRLGSSPFIAEEVSLEAKVNLPPPKKTTRKLATAAPGCGCGTCVSCRLFRALQDDAANWDTRAGVVDD